MQQLIPMTRPDRMLDAGLPYETTDAARWAYRTREQTGLADAFVRIGRRVYIDPDRFHALARGRQAT